MTDPVGGVVMSGRNEEDAFSIDAEFGTPSLGKTVVIGCGNLLRGDDAVGPILIRNLWTADPPEHVLLVDGGTAGMDMAFKMHGARRVILIDAAATGSEPGTIFKVPGEELEDLPPLQGLHSHQFRWDNALAFARWLLKDQYPEDITVFLIEVESCHPGDELTESVVRSMHIVERLVTEMWQTDGDDIGDPCQIVTTDPKEPAGERR